MSKDPVHDIYRQDLPDRPLSADDIRQLRFGVTLRDYAMAQDDDVLDRLAREISEKDATIAALTAAADGGSTSRTPSRTAPGPLAAESPPTL